MSKTAKMSQIRSKSGQIYFGPWDETELILQNALQSLCDGNYRVVTVLAMFLTNLHKIVLHKMHGLHRKPCSIIKNHKY